VLGRGYPRADQNFRASNWEAVGHHARARMAPALRCIRREERGVAPHSPNDPAPTPLSGASTTTTGSTPTRSPVVPVQAPVGDDQPSPPDHHARPRDPAADPASPLEGVGPVASGERPGCRLERLTEFRQALLRRRRASAGVRHPCHSMARVTTCRVVRAWTIIGSSWDGAGGKDLQSYARHHGVFAPSPWRSAVDLPADRHRVDAHTDLLAPLSRSASPRSTPPFAPPHRPAEGRTGPAASLRPPGHRGRRPARGRSPSPPARPVGPQDRGTHWRRAGRPAPPARTDRSLAPAHPGHTPGASRLG